MENCKIQYCKLCLTTIHDENFEVVDEVSKNILDSLLLKLNFDDEYKHVMCNVCYTKLFAAHEFKLTCFHTDIVINSYADDTTMLPLDLREIYMKEINCEGISDNIKICRLCMHPMKNVLEFNLINEEQVDMILKFVPEMNIFMVKEPVMCKLCHDTLVEHCNFLKKCTDLEQNIGSISNGHISEAPSPATSVNMFVKTEDFNDEFEEETHLIKTECLDINYEDIVNESEIHEQEAASEAATSKRYKGECYERKCDYETEAIFSLNSHEITKHEQSNFENYNLETTYETNLEKQKLNQEDSSVYSCEKCDYKTMSKGNLKSHYLKHKDPSEVQMYECESCNYETKYKISLKKHMLIHRDASEVDIYECEKCNYKTKHKMGLKKHMLIHKDPSEVQMYKCITCSYETKYKISIRRHLTIHRDLSEVQMYRCQICNFETKDWKYIKDHMLIHEHSSEVQIYKCEKCNYENQYEADQHRVSAHKGSSEVQVYKCENCNYESKSKGYVKYMLTNIDPPEAQMYRCVTCNYETKYDTAIRRHMLRHKDASEVHMYECEKCDHKTKYKASLKRHMLTHK